MNRRNYLGLGVLIIILIAAGGFIYWQWSEVQKFKKQLAQDAKHLEGNDKTVAVDELPPAEPGFKWVRHGDHWDKVPVAQSEVPHQTPASEEIAFETSVLKSDLPDEIPDEFPTDEELQQMSYWDLEHLQSLYLKEVMKLRKIDYDASVRFHNSTLPKIWEKKNEKYAEIMTLSKKLDEMMLSIPLQIPADVIIEYGENPSEGGNE